MTAYRKKLIEVALPPRPSISRGGEREGHPAGHTRTGQPGPGGGFVRMTRVVGMMGSRNGGFQMQFQPNSNAIRSP